MDTNGIGGIVAFVLGWLCAQTGKLIGDIIKSKRPLKAQEVIDCYFRSGGMPSGHTASFVSLTVYLGMRYGFLSGIFALALAMTIIVVYDAVNVRYAVGEQGKLLNLIAETDNNKNTRKMKVIEGHTVPQAIVGGILGIVLGLICGMIF
jgi:acid phosphatase family membrane protein YuiD